MNSHAPAIPWYRIHLVTHVVLMLVGAALLWIQTLFSKYQVLDSSLCYGWPLGYHDPFSAMRTSNSNYSLFSVCVNTIVAVTLILCTGFFVEVLIRRFNSRLQFTLTVALVVIIVAAIILGERYAGWNMYILADRMQLRPSALMGYPWYCWAPIYFAIFCTLCSIIWLALNAISRAFRRFDR